MQKCRRMEKPQFTSKNWIYSWQLKSSKTRQQYCRLESFAMKTDILVNGSTVKNHISSKTGLGFPATLRTWFLVVPGLSNSSSGSDSSTSTESHCSTFSSSSSSPTVSDIWTRERLNAETHTPVLLMNHLWSLRLRQLWIWYSVDTHFHKDRHSEVCKWTKIRKDPSRRRNGGGVLRAENFGELIQQITKFSVTTSNVSVQNKKTSQETQRSSQQFLEPNTKPKVINTDSSLEFGKACEDLSWNHSTSTHRSETNGIADRAMRRVKGSSAVLLQSGLNESWWADSMECFALSAKRHRFTI